MKKIPNPLFSFFSWWTFKSIWVLIYNKFDSLVFRTNISDDALFSLSPALEINPPSLSALLLECRWKGDLLAASVSWDDEDEQLISSTLAAAGDAILTVAAVELELNDLLKFFSLWAGDEEVEGAGKSAREDTEAALLINEDFFVGGVGDSVVLSLSERRSRDEVSRTVVVIDSSRLMFPGIDLATAAATAAAAASADAAAWFRGWMLLLLLFFTSCCCWIESFRLFVVVSDSLSMSRFRSVVDFVECCWLLIEVFESLLLLWWLLAIYHMVRNRLV